MLCVLNDAYSRMDDNDINIKDYHTKDYGGNSKKTEDAGQDEAADEH